MAKRFVSIWFRYLFTDWFTRRETGLKQTPFVLASPVHGRMVITAANAIAQQQGIDNGMVVADARAIIPSLKVLDYKPELPPELLKGIADWCIRYTPAVGIDLPDGLILDATGCAHLWGGEKEYLCDIIKKLNHFGYYVRAAIADTIGTAWAISRFGNGTGIIERGQQTNALLSLSPAVLRLEPATAERLNKLGLRHISDIISMPRTALRRRFGEDFLLRLNQALGYEEERITPVQPIEHYQERLPCMEPILTATGIEIALQRLLDTLCHLLQQEQKGLRVAVFKGYRMDGKIEKISIETIRPSSNSKHLFNLFEMKLGTIEPASGIELFMLEAPVVEDLLPAQEKLWKNNPGLEDTGVSELLDRLAGKIGSKRIHRYIPDEHYWPERSFKRASSIADKPVTAWKTNTSRPIRILAKPELIEVTAPVPDYPPMLFRYKGQLHKILKSDGPERIEQEWWLQDGQHRDYYSVEDEKGRRYWLFRSGHYDAARSYKWFIHGFFA